MTAVAEVGSVGPYRSDVHLGQRARFFFFFFFNQLKMRPGRSPNIPQGIVAGQLRANSVNLFLKKWQ